MTQEEKAKAYDEALEKARQLCAYPTTKPFIRDLQDIFPELKESESEDERIRKEIIYHIKNCDDTIDEKTEKRMIAWLEKQGEHDSIEELNFFDDFRNSDVEVESNEDGLIADTVRYKREKQGDDKVESKFKVGDWVVVDDGRIGRIIECTKDFADVDLEFSCLSTRVHNIRSWTIQDAKAGDVLHSTGWHNDCIFIFNGLDNWRFDEPNGDRAVATGYCCLFVSADNMEFGIQGPDCIEVDTVKPATKIQRDLLEKAIADAGYEWDAELKQLKKIEQKPTEWNEEDESKRNLCFKYLTAQKNYQSAVGIDYINGCLDWLDSIKERVLPQPKQEWSKKDEENSKNILYILNQLKGNAIYSEDKIAENCIDWLKNIKDRVQPQSQWKPSDRQMKALGVATNICSVPEKEYLELEKLYQDLKKLKD